MCELRTLVSAKDWKADFFRNSPRDLDANVPVLLVGNKVRMQHVAT